MGTPPVDTEAPPFLYTSRDELDSLFSEVGVRLRLDDLYSDKGLATYLDDVIEDATEEVNMYLAWKYFEEDLYKSRWVRRRCSRIGCYYLSQRRGNPKQFKTLYDETIYDFERIYAGELNVPRLMHRATFLPTAANLVIDNRYVSPPQRTSGFSRKIGWL